MEMSTAGADHALIFRYVTDGSSKAGAAPVSTTICLEYTCRQHNSNAAHQESQSKQHEALQNKVLIMHGTYAAFACVMQC